MTDRKKSWKVFFSFNFTSFLTPTNAYSPARPHPHALTQTHTWTQTHTSPLSLSLSLFTLNHFLNIFLVEGYFSLYLCWFFSLSDFLSFFPNLSPSLPHSLSSFSVFYLPHNLPSLHPGYFLSFSAFLAFFPTFNCLASGTFPLFTFKNIFFVHIITLSLFHLTQH